MRHLVRNAPKHKAFHPSHASVPDDHEVGIHGLSNADERISRVTLGIVHLDRHPLAFGLGKQLRPDAVSVVAQTGTCGLRYSRNVRESRSGYGVNRMNSMKLGPCHLGQGNGLSHGACCAV
jgi:hypothetical protein